jgi:glycosyltransferase involved in cell wall biosynthesis
MSDDNIGIKRIILFYGSIAEPGGSQKVLFEEARYLKKIGIETSILTYRYSTDAYGDIYKMKIDIINEKKTDCNSSIFGKMSKLLNTREKIRTINPDIIIAQSYGDCMSLYFATLFTPLSYVVHIPETIFRYHRSYEKYAFIHKKVFNEIRKATTGGREFISSKPPKSSFAKRIIAELFAIFLYIGIRKAKKIFVLSNQIRWEVKKLYGKDAIVLKGAFPSDTLNYKPKQDIKEKLELNGKRMILNVNRLDPRKRVDLLIRAFNQICNEFADVVLIIGGLGPEKEKLKNLAKELNLKDKVKFMGYIPEEELWDYLAACDVFVHPNWADFAIAPYEALALQKKVVWSSEMEMDENLATNRHIFVADPTVDDFARAIKETLTTEVTENDDMSKYTWDEYFKGVMDELVD